MGYRWPQDTVFKRVELDVIDRSCPFCRTKMHRCDHRHHRIFTFGGPVHIVSNLTHCPDESCPGHHRTFSPEEECSLTMPWWVMGWDVFAWIGHRRFARHWSVGQLRAELRDSHGIALSEDCLEDHIRRYEVMVAARQDDRRTLAADYRDQKDVMLSIDGLQPEKGHETLYVVRELRRRRVWFAEALISSSMDEVRRLLTRARQYAADLGLPIALWMSDKQEAFVQGIAREFPGVPHRYCVNHFLRDLAKPVLEADSHAKVALRRKIRGLRAIERDALKDSVDSGGLAPTANEPQQVVLDYCTTVRGILNSDQGGPLDPPGLRMAGAIREVRSSLQRNLEEKKGGSSTSGSSGSPDASTGGWRKFKRRRRKSDGT